MKSHPFGTVAASLFLSLTWTLAWGGDLPPCGKNHYILDQPCAPGATDMAIGGPTGLAIDASGNLHFSSQSVVFRVDASGSLERIAGTGRAGFAGDGGPAADALLNFPSVYPELEHDPIDFWEFAAGLAFDAAGNLYIADSYNNRIRKVNAGDGTISTYIGGATRRKDDVGLPIFSGFWWPQGLAFDAQGRLYVTGQYGSLLRIPKGDAPVDPIADSLEVPEGIAIDGEGNIFVAEAVCTIKKVRPDGKVTVAVASALCWGYASGEPGKGLAWPYGVAVDSEGNLFIADTYNHCIRRKAPAGELKTIAGECDLGSKGFSGDGGPAISAQLNAPHGVTVDARGNVYVADTGNNRVRMIDPRGVIVTIAGNGNPLPP